MKHKNSRILSMIIAGVMLVTTLGFVGFSAQDVSADGIDPIPTSINMYYYKVKGTYENLADLAYDNEWTIKDVTFSKKKVASLVHMDGMYYVRAKKAGTTTMKFLAKPNNSDKFVKKTVKIKVTKYKNPAKQFKIGKKNLTKKFNKVDYYVLKKNYSGKLKVKGKNGWKVKGIYFYDGQTKKEKKIKNKSKVNLDLYDALMVTMKKGKKTTDLYLLGDKVLIGGED